LATKSTFLLQGHMNHAPQKQTDARRAVIGADIRYVLAGLAVGCLLVLVKVIVEITPLGPWAERQVYELLVEQIPNFSRKGPGVVVVDIGHLEGGENPATGGLVPTGREALLELLEQLKVQRPLAIGIDIDFSPTPTGWATPGDPVFFDRCLVIDAGGVPVRLGVYRTMREPREAWLGAPKYAALAASLWLPDGDTRRLPMDIRVEGASERLLTLGAAVAVPARAREQRPWHALFTQAVVHRTQVFERNSPAVHLSDVLVNYALQDQMKREMLPLATPADIVKHRDDLRGKIVLIGDGRNPRAIDMFPVPNSAINHAPGVMLHASLANTLFQAPLYEFTHLARLVIDVTLLLVVLVAIVVTKRMTRSKTHKAAEAVELRVIRWTVLAIVLGGFALVIYFQVLWLDFLLVCFFLLVHPRVEQWIHSLLHRVNAPTKHEGASS
jgi:CHASE2 domain-containing sensor protein